MGQRGGQARRAHVARVGVLVLGAEVRGCGGFQVVRVARRRAVDLTRHTRRRVAVRLPARTTRHRVSSEPLELRGERPLFGPQFGNASGSTILKCGGQRCKGTPGAEGALRQREERHKQSEELHAGRLAAQSIRMRPSFNKGFTGGVSQAPLPWPMFAEQINLFVTQANSILLKSFRKSDALDGFNILK